ncbi:LutC/YkgG family protein [Sphaerisporangium corydalis]|uniref:Lactate utilization protein C n=1 Tax=Sphaerisporangium corydalis TaxID=1441875 RepID=A0ABV9EMK7_9ACTN|nr:LUD domain-containing protein [Sphaerisporangium corydalis]
MSSRDLILSRIRAAVAGAPEVVIPRAYRPAGPEEGRVELFAERVADYRAIVRLVPVEEVATAVAAALAARGARRVVVPAGLPEEWLGSVPGLERLGDDPPLGVTGLDAADGVVTGCAAGVAETGTIVLDAGPGQGRRALTLLPDYHLCVVLADQIVATVPEALARLDPVRPLTWISGPSATSDIELNRVEGVHGPRTLEVIIGA